MKDKESNNVDIIKKEVEQIKDNQRRKDVMLKMFMEIFFMILITFFTYFIHNIFIEEMTDRDVMSMVICWIIIVSVVCWIVFLSKANLIRKLSVFVLVIFNGILLNGIISYLMEVPFDKVIAKEIIIILIMFLIFLSCKFKGVVKFITIFAIVILAKIVLFEAIISIGEISIFLIVWFIEEQKGVVKNNEINVIKSETIKFELFIYLFFISMLVVACSSM